MLSLLTIRHISILLAFFKGDSLVLYKYIRRVQLHRIDLPALISDMGLCTMWSG